MSAIAQVRAPAFRYLGGKFRIGPWVIQKMPPHRVYVEAFGGSAGIMLQKPRAAVEVYNDLDGDVVSFFRTVRDPELRRRLIEAVELTPYSRAEFREAWESASNPVERARRLLIRSQMGFGAAGATKNRTGFRAYSGTGTCKDRQVWTSMPDRISAVGVRFTGVVIEQRDALQVMRAHDSAETLHYVDPPYIHGVRVGVRYYRHEMTDAQHLELLRGVMELKGMVMLSGYMSDMYATHLREWGLCRRRARIAGRRGTAIRTECLWINPAAQQAFCGVGDLFAQVGSGQ